MNITGHKRILLAAWRDTRDMGNVGPFPAYGMALRCFPAHFGQKDTPFGWSLYRSSDGRHGEPLATGTAPTEAEAMAECAAVVVGHFAITEAAS